jgi:hypothetical protein
MYAEQERWLVIEKLERTLHYEIPALLLSYLPVHHEEVKLRLQNIHLRLNSHKELQYG